MKLRNILPIACFLMAAVSCSMEDELINSVDGAKNDKEVAIALQVSAPMTKATEKPTAAEAGIDHCSIILINGSGNVIRAIDGAKVKANGIVYTGVGDQAADTVKFVVKVADAKNYKVMIVANSTLAYKDYTTLESIQKSFQTADDYGKFVKVGIGNVVIDAAWPGHPGYESIENAILGHPVVVPVELTQLEARIEVASFKAINFNSMSVPQDVVLTKVEFLYLYTKSYTDYADHAQQTGSEDCYTDTEVTCGTGIKVFDAATSTSFHEIVEDKKPFAYSYRNTDGASPVAVVLHYEVGGQARKTKAIEIDGGSVIGGNLYRLFVEMEALNFDDVKVSIKCYTLDWDYNRLTLSSELQY